MPLYWLCYRHNNQISVVIEPGFSVASLGMGQVQSGYFLLFLLRYQAK